MRELVKESGIKAKPLGTFELSPFGITEIQYIRGLIWYDKIANEYETNPQITIDRKMSMHEFTSRILDKLDELEGEEI